MIEPIHRLQKVLTSDAVRTSDVATTMGCGDACPYFPRLGDGSGARLPSGAMWAKICWTSVST